MERQVTDAAPTAAAAWYARMHELYDTSPMHRYLGLSLDHVEDGKVVVSVQAKPELSNALGMLHGSVQMAAMDSAVLQAVRTRCREGDHLVTIEMKVNFLTGAFGSGFVCTAKVLRVGGSIGVAEARITAPDGGIVAGGLGTIHVRRAKRAAMEG